MSAALLLVGLAIGLSLAMTAAWAIAIRSGQSGWIDAVWSFAVGIAAVIGAVAMLGPAPGPSPRQWVVAVLAGVWSLRLGLHIAARTAKGGDDPRYAKLREEWGASFRSRLLWFLQIQAAVAWVLAGSVTAAAHNPAPGLGMGDGLGIALLVIAIAGEGIADRQLAHFRSDPNNHGRVCDVGLWSVSRHPNYFFQWLGWLAFAVIAIVPEPACGWGWTALAGPAVMYWLLVYVSGIPPLEEHMLRSRGAAFRDYQARVNAFWPGPSRGTVKLSRSGLR